MPIKLYDYQIEVIKSTLSTNKTTLIQIPTGGGKTLISKEIIRALISQDKQVLFVAPKIVLMDQTIKVFEELDPHIIHGTNEYNHNHHLLVSTIQTASRREIDPDIIFIDEIHFGFDGKMIQDLLRNKPKVRLIGLSATPFDKNGKLLKGFGKVIDNYDLNYMVKNGYLVNIQSFELVHIYNLDKINITAGDYNLKELSKVVSNNHTILEIVNTTFNYIHNNKKAIVFAVDINHAELLTIAYQNEGFNAKALHSKMSRDEIDYEIEQFRIGNTKILVSVLMLTTGFDVPDTDVAVIARPTKSQNLYKQMVGRVLRLADGKSKAILLDCGNVIENLGLPLEPIKERVVVETENVNKCKSCGSEKLKLQKKEGVSRWICEKCGFHREIEEGVYECKICKRTYSHNAKFEIKNNKLYLVCDDCPYPTLISEFSGSETFVEVNEKRIDEKYLPFIEARKYIHNLDITNNQWKKIVSKVKSDVTDILPNNIPIHPEKTYQNSGWKDLNDWLGYGIEDGYLSFDEAKKFVEELELYRSNLWTKYVNGELEYLSKKPDNIPKLPQKVYINSGWNGFDDWLGIENNFTKNLKNLEMSIDNKDFEKKLDIFTNQVMNWDKSIEIIFDKLDKNKILKLIDNVDEYIKRIFLNYALKINTLDLFISIANMTYKVKHTFKFDENLKKIDLDEPYYTFNKVIRYLDISIISDILNNNSHDDINKVLETIIDNLDCFDDEFKSKLLLEFYLHNKYEMGIKLIKSGLELETILDDLKEHENLIDTIKMFRNEWTKVDITSKIEYFLEDLDIGSFFIHDIGEFKDILMVLEENTIKVNFQPYLNELITYINEKKLVSNYVQDENNNVTVIDVKKFINHLIKFILNNNVDTDDLDFFNTIIHNFDVSIVKLFYKNEYSQKAILENFDFKKMMNPLEIAKKNNNKAVIEFLEKKKIITND